MAQIGSFGTLQPKSALRTIGKVLGIEYNEVEKMNKSVQDNASLQESIDASSELQEFQRAYPQLFAYALRLEGLERNMTVHAGGVVITPQDKTMSDFTALSRSKQDGEITQYEMENCEEVGLVKMDFLGLSTLDVIYDCYKLIQEKNPDFKPFIPEEMNLEDQEVYGMLQKGLTKGVFQLGSKGITESCMELKPENFEELTDLISLYRPATMQGLEKYIQKKNGELETESISPVVDEILEPTRGELIYQEQMMKLLRAMGGFSPGEADHARKISSKKKEEEFHEVMEDFKKRAKENGHSEKAISTVYDMIKGSASYSFAKAHGVSYAMLTYITAYLKHYYPKEFFCSLLTNQRTDASLDNEALNEYIKEAERMGVKICLPDINKSEMEFAINKEDGEIYFGLAMIKGCDRKILQKLLNKRPFKTFDEILAITISKNALVPLIKTGALSSVKGKNHKGFNDREGLLIDFLVERYERGAESKKELKNINKKHCETLLYEGLISKDEIPIFGKSFKKSEKVEERINDKKKERCLKLINKLNKKEAWEKWQRDVMAGDNAIWEYQLLSYSSNTELFSNRFKDDFSDRPEGSVFDLPCIISKIDKKKIKSGRNKGKEMAILDLDTPSGEIRAVAFAHVWSSFKHDLVKDKRLVLEGQKKDNQFNVQGVMDYKKYVDNFAS